jgi:hypothetical protein
MTTKKLYENLAGYATSDGQNLVDLVNPFSVDTAEVIEAALRIDAITPNDVERILNAI